jgi:IclR family transcriptional regulator, acetate operon repressor
MKVKQVENMLDLIELFARDKAPRTLTALSNMLGMPKSSTFNMIDTLMARGFLYETRQRGGYYPTRRLVDLARDITEGDAFLQRIHGELKLLAANTGETVLLSVRDRDEVIYIDVVESSALIRYFAKVGERRPVYATSSGKAILTTFGEPERTSILDSLAYVAHEKTTVRNCREMAADLDLAMQRGWCEDRGEYTPDVMGIGVPVIHYERRFGLAVAGPMFRMQDRRTDLAALLLATAARVRAIMEE